MSNQVSPFISDAEKRETDQLPTFAAILAVAATTLFFQAVTASHAQWLTGGNQVY